MSCHKMTQMHPMEYCEKAEISKMYYTHTHTPLPDNLEPIL